ncbi:hypothetical protein [Clostridium sp. YIM B02551]|uniref:hypothetical protein n=1 Tax=Clostridium sp. YIM B02551 TaxID=2910679 RepID=UPI001EEBA2CD|nr:hypothetical protein [Clostridium sp. YIM B02551]
MKIKKVIYLSLLLICSLATVSKATETSDPISNTYKQGVYSIAELQDYKATATLVTPNNRTSVSILDHEGDIRFFKEFDTVNEVINLGTIRNGDTISIVGSGEIAVIYKNSTQ